MNSRSGEATTKGASEKSLIREDRWIKPSELPKGEFLVTAVLPNGSKPPSVNLFDHLNLVNVHSISEVRYVSSSVDFPPEPYSNTGRGPKPYGPYYAGIGSGSAVFELDNGESRALSAVFTLDRTGHGNSIEHVNVRIVGWPANTFRPDNTVEIGDMHKMPANVNITLRVADGSKIEKCVVVMPKTKWQSRVE